MNIAIESMIGADGCINLEFGEKYGAGCFWVLGGGGGGGVIPLELPNKL